MDFLNVDSLPMALVFLGVGLFLLIKGGDSIVDGAVGFSEKMGLPQAFVGLTIVAFGTSAPELFTSVLASMRGKADISVGNVFGSNIFNLCLVLGLVGLVAQFNVTKKNFVWDWFILVLSCLMFWILALDLTVGFMDGLTLFAFYVVFVTLNLMAIQKGKRKLRAQQSHQENKSKNFETKDLMKDILWIALGLILLVVGAKVALDGGIQIGKSVGLSDRIIGLVVLAVGTSLPELITSVVAAMKGRNDIAVSNIVGSNIMNILIALGVTAMISPLEISSSMINPDLYVVMISSVLLGVLIAAFKFNFNRFQAVFWLLFFAAYFYKYIYATAGI